MSETITISTSPPRLLDLTLAELGWLRAIIRGEESDEARTTHVRLRELDERETPLDVLCDGLGLSDFERAVLLLAAGPDLVSAVAGELENRTGVPHITFGSALAMLPEAHWSALAPDGPLRHWMLLSLEDPTRLTASRLIVDEAIVHQIVGLPAGTAGREFAVRPLTETGAPIGAHLAAARQLGDLWSHSAVRLHGVSAVDARTIVAAAAGGRPAHEMVAETLSPDLFEEARTLRRCVRDAVLERAALLIDLSTTDRARARRITEAVRNTPLIATVGGPGLGLSLEVEPVSIDDRIERLRTAFALRGVETDPAPIAATFDLRGRAVDEVALDAAAGRDAWDAARRLVRVEQTLAPRIVTKATWDALVLPEPVMTQLRALVATVRNRRTVLGEWGFGATRTRGLGTSALFSGASGTGKTFAAEVIAAELRLDLLRVDLSQVVDKYIGETEKHLAELFDAAERSSAVLLFDEADAVFGKRTEVRDSHDRYANVEVGYLLQRLEAFTGLAILTSNARGALDQAFVRRLTAIVSFPYPGLVARRQLWERAIPATTPRGDLCLDAIAHVDASGGAITSAALAAAYLAADAGVALSTHDVEQALAWESEKSGR